MNTHYKIREGEFGGEECYRLEIDHGGVYITFDEVSGYSNVFLLWRNGEQRAHIKKSRLPNNVKLQLEEIKEEEE